MIALQAHQLGKPYQLWITLAVNDAAQDAVYLHTANPNPDSEFPISLPDAQWNVTPVTDMFSRWLPEFSFEVGYLDGNYFVFAQNYGVSLRQKPSEDL